MPKAHLNPTMLFAKWHTDGEWADTKQKNQPFLKVKSGTWMT